MLNVQEVCPQQTDISSALVSFATLVAAAADGKAPVNTEAQDTSQSSRNEVSSQLFVWDSDGTDHYYASASLIHFILHFAFILKHPYC